MGGTSNLDARRELQHFSIAAWAAGSAFLILAALTTVRGDTPIMSAAVARVMEGELRPSSPFALNWLLPCVKFARSAAMAGQSTASSPIRADQSGTAPMVRVIGAAASPDVASKYFDSQSRALQSPSMASATARWTIRFHLGAVHSSDRAAR